MKQFFLIFLIFISHHSFSQEENFKRNISIGYQFFSTWLPGKKVVSYAQRLDAKWVAELEYAWNSYSVPVSGIVDLGEISEKRLTLQGRYYTGQSFHYIVGVFRNEFKARLGSDLLVTDASHNAFAVSNMGATVGIGNKWSIKRVTLGVDWIKINYPMFLKQTQSAVLGDVEKNDRSDMRGLINKIEDLPTFVLLGVNLGYSF